MLTVHCKVILSKNHKLMALWPLFRLSFACLKWRFHFRSTSMFLWKFSFWSKAITSICLGAGDPCSQIFTTLSCLFIKSLNLNAFVPSIFNGFILVNQTSLIYWISTFYFLCLIQGYLILFLDCLISLFQIF